MDFTISAADLDFRKEVRGFIEAELPADIARRGQHDYHSARDDVRRWMQILNRKGWSAPHWRVWISAKSTPLLPPCRA